MPATFNKVDYVMITVSNMARSVAFYKDKLGIPMKFGTPEWTEFQTGTTVLALHGGGTPRKRLAIRRSTTPVPARSASMSTISIWPTNSFRRKVSSL